MKPLSRIVFLVLVGGLAATPAAAGELFVASWNVENLFDTLDDPRVELDEEFTPTAPKKWTDERYQTKLRNLAQVIRKMNDNQGPDILGLCEIENRTVLTDLVAQLAPLQRKYRIVHQDSPSGRGIDCAILYDENRVKLHGQKFHNLQGIRTRDIVEARLQVGEQVLYVFMNHWPSRSGSPASERAKLAQVLRFRLDALLAEDARADIVILGDLNDEPDDLSVKEHLKTSGEPANLPKGTFYNTMTPIKQTRKGSYVYNNKWEVIDHVIVSPGLLDDRAFRWKPASTQLIQFDFQIFTPNNPNQIPRPNRTYSGDVYHFRGYSDHLPVACVLQY
jgi:predicted extracellular nuclease